MRYAEPVTIDRHARRLVPAAQDSRIVYNTDLPHWIRGYVLRWRECQPSEAFLNGCFARSIKEAVPSGKIKLIAALSTGLECVGTVTRAAEDEGGLFVRADLFDGEFVQWLKKGEIYGLSSSFLPVRWTWQAGARGAVLTHSEARLVEVVASVIPPKPSLWSSWFDRLRIPNFPTLASKGHPK